MNQSIVRVEGRNAWGKLPYATLEIRHQSEERHFTDGLPSFEAAQDKLRQLLQNRRASLLEALANIDHNIDNFDGLFGEPKQSLQELIYSQLTQLPALFADMMERPRSERIGSLQVTNRYLDSPSSLWVFQLPDTGSVVESFSTEVISLLMQALQVAGLEYVTDWNGVGFFTWSVRIRELATAQLEEAVA